MRLFFILFCLILFGSVKSQRLVLPGANPDPSVVKIGNTYWASATSSNWFPAFPLMYSKDLVNWKQRGYIFYKMPDWSDYYFWAPEITYDSGRVYVYYTAHKKGGNLCIGVASANRPEGPYRDHGPLMCQEAGSIDAFPIRDTSGKLFMVWKEDANSISRPTPIWAQEMNEERTALIGEKRELFRNDAPWEKELVEGVSIVRHGAYYYAFYAAAGCCGSRCTYVSGVARAKDVLGPWEKYNKNPILVDDSSWLCKGHGTPIERNGRFYFLYHGYDRETSAFTGREGLLQEFRFTEDDWIEFINTPSQHLQRNELIREDFNKKKLPETWQWSVFDTLRFNLRDDNLYLYAKPEDAGSFLAPKISSADYTATATINADHSTANAGIAAIGNEKNTLGLFFKDNQVKILKVEDGKQSLLGLIRIPPKERIYLQMRVQGGYNISFLYSFTGKDFILLNETPLVGAFLPPWDSPPRAGLVAKGERNEKAIFEDFEIRVGTAAPVVIAGTGKWLYAFKLIFYILAAGSVIFGLLYWYEKSRTTKNSSNS